MYRWWLKCNQYIYPFIKDDVALYGVEAAGQGEDTDKHALAIGKGSPGVLHGTKMYLIQDEGGQVQLAHSISAGLDYLVLDQNILITTTLVE